MKEFQGEAMSFESKLMALTSNRAKTRLLPNPNPERLSTRLKNQQRLALFLLQVMNGGNVTAGSVILMPERTDNGETLTCQATNPDIPNSTLEDSAMLTVLCK